MKSAILCFIFVLLAPVKLYGRITFECPPEDQIYPCTCSVHPTKIVKCEDVKSLDTVNKALENHFKAPLPSLQISNIHTFELPDHAFRNISTKRLVLKDSSFRHIDDEAFDGQNSLKLLNLLQDRLTEFPTEALKRVSGLHSLSLAGNFLMRIEEDSIPDLDKLKFLILSDNRISSIDKNSFPKSLESISLYKNLLKTLNRTMLNLKNLELLTLTQNRLTSVYGEFDGLSNLRHLSLDRNNIQDITDSFTDLKSLRMLNLAYNKLEEVEDGLFPLTKLTHLNLSYNYITQLSEYLFEEINILETLDLSGNYIQNICQTIKPLTSLENLYLSNTNLDELEFDCFQDMRNLKRLDLSQNGIANINAITAHSFPNLMFLHLQQNMLQNFRHGLKNLKKLRTLDISDNKFTSIKGHHFIYNTELDLFIIEGNPWDCSDHLLAVLRDLESKTVNVVGAPICYLTDNAL